MADGWKWKVRGSRKLPDKEPRYRRSLYFYHGQDSEERSFKRYVYERLVLLLLCRRRPQLLRAHPRRRAATPCQHDP